MIVFWGVFLTGIVAHAGTCDLVSGSFKTTTVACQHTYDGKTFFEEGYNDIKVSFNEESHELTIVMNVSHNPYTLNYIADGKEREGRPMYEGDKYTAVCENNNIRTRAVMSALKYPLLTDFVMSRGGEMLFKQSFEGNSYLRFCKMDRI